MKKLLLLLLLLQIVSANIHAEQKTPTEEQLKEVTERGRNLHEYIRAFTASYEVLSKELQPNQESPLCIPQKNGATFKFDCGYLSKKNDKFYVFYETSQSTLSEKFKVTKYNPPKEDTGYLFNGARALKLVYTQVRSLMAVALLIKFDLVTKDGKPAPQIPFDYSVYLMPAPDEKFWIYVLPPLSSEYVALGWDYRYLISKDGKKILERRPLHRSGLAFSLSSAVKSEVEIGYHTDTLNNIPQDTDVFYVLMRPHNIPEMIATEKFVYKIEVDGAIRYLGTVKEVLGDRKKTYKPKL